MDQRDATLLALKMEEGATRQGTLEGGKGEETASC